ncbi:MAG: 2-oxoacid:acceptor oxidoreductase family protein [Nitrospinae bacterium]|nr:2-oxoacid:acceptor oxidoreductase family protein [Nitrospinota bacterium]
MLRIRLHGRGGQGIKTASQILGTAGFISGYRAQDFPLYGAERRGAPIVAFTRLDRGDILERGAIACPDLILVGDETLLDDNIAAPLAGADSNTKIFINSKHSTQALKDHFGLDAELVTADLADPCLRHIQKETVLSTALAAAGARMTGIIGLDALREAIGLELKSFLGEELYQRNLVLADEVFNATSPVSLREHGLVPMTPAPLAVMEQENVAQAMPLILALSNMGLRKTGNWRVYRPDIDYEQCNKCWICFARCPEGAVGIDDGGRPTIDYDHCKGCLICAEECPKETIRVTRETASWA